jgi:hypothetical protein
MPEGLKKALALENENPEYIYFLGRYLHISDYKAPRSEVLSLYKRALELSPFDYNYWLSLAELLAEEGEKEKALYILNHTTEMAPGVMSLRWRAGVLGIKLGDKETLSVNFRAVIASDPKRRTEAYAALWEIIGQEGEILVLVSDNALSSYLRFLMDTGRVEETKLVWKRLGEAGETSRDLALDYVSFLLKEDQISLAQGVWREIFGDRKGMWNGNFGETPMNGGFDWRLGKPEGVSIERENDNGNFSIELIFDGEHNVDFYHLWQIVPVDEGSKYILSSYMKSDGITTRNGVQWEIYCYKSEGLHFTTEPLVGTHDWRLVNLPFQTPKDCHAIVVRLRRFESDKLDRYIKGRVWVGKVELNKSIQDKTEPNLR